MAALGQELQAVCIKALEDHLNQKMEDEVTAALEAEKSERKEDRKGFRSGHYYRTIYTLVGPLRLKVPRVREMAWHPSFLIPRQKVSVGLMETIISLYIGGLSTRTIVMILKRVFRVSLSRGTVSNLTRRFHALVEKWCSRPIAGDQWTFLHVDAVYIPCRQDGKVGSVPFFIALGRDAQGNWDILGLREGMAEDRANWRDFLLSLKERGLSDVHMVIGDGETSLPAAVEDVFPGARFQHCMVHFFRTVYTSVDGKKRADTAELVKPIYACEDLETALAVAGGVKDVLRGDGRDVAAQKLDDHLHATLAHMDWADPALWPMIRSNNLLERLNLEIKRRTKAMASFPNVVSARMLIGARLFQMVQAVWTEGPDAAMAEVGEAA